MLQHSTSQNKSPESTTDTNT